MPVGEALASQAPSGPPAKLTSLPAGIVCDVVSVNGPLPETAVTTVEGAGNPVATTVSPTSGAGPAASARLISSVPVGEALPSHAPPGPPANDTPLAPGASCETDTA